MIGWLLRRIVRLILFLVRSPWLLVQGILDRVVGQAVLTIKLTEKVPWFHDDDPPWRRLLGIKPERLSLEEALASLDEATRSKAIKGVRLELDRTELSLAQAEVLLTAIDRAKGAGTKVLVWVDGLTGPALVVAAAADKAYGLPEGQIEFLGIRVRALFVHDLLRLLGVVPQLDHHGEYKTMSDMFQRRSMSPAHEEMSKDLGGDLYEQLLTPLIMGRGLAREAAALALDEGPLSNAEATERKLLDGVAYQDETERLSGELLGLADDKKPSACAVGRVLTRRRRRQFLGSVLRDRGLVLVIDVHGTIVGGERGRGCPALPVVRALDEAREAKHVRAVVLRIDSPGGSALASDLMWRAARRLNEEKPLVASLGNVAASGGYYLAVAARRILAHAASLVGSIGVVSGKFHAAPAFHRWGVAFEGVSFGARAGMYDPDRGFSPEEAEANRKGMMRFYETFLSRVAEGRGKTRDEIDAVAQGRVYTGRRALGLGLVDAIGGVEEAVNAAAELAELRLPVRVERLVPNKRTLAQQLRLPGALSNELAEGLEALTVAASLSREPALAYCPWRVEGA